MNHTNHNSSYLEPWRRSHITPRLQVGMEVGKTTRSSQDLSSAALWWANLYLVLVAAACQNALMLLFCFLPRI